MAIRSRAALLALALAAAGCKSMPSTVLLHILAAPGLTPPDELRLSVFGPGGGLVSLQRVPAQGQPVLPGELVLYPRDPAAPIRIYLRALLAASPVGDGAAQAQPRAGKQIEATVTLAPGLLADGDGSRT